MPDTLTPTETELKKVRAWECTQEGHVLEVLIRNDGVAPGAIKCLHCGEVWPVLKLRRHRTEAP